MHDDKGYQMTDVKESAYTIPIRGDILPIAHSFSWPAFLGLLDFPLGPFQCFAGTKI